MFFKRRTSSTPQAPATAAPTSTTDVGLSTLVDSCREIAALRDVAEIRRRTVTRAVELTGAEVGAFLSCDETAHYAFQSHPQLFTMSEVRGPSLLHAVRTRSALCDVLVDEPSIALSPIAVAAVPAVAAGRLIGMLIVVRDANDPFGNTELETLSLLGPVAASTLATAGPSAHQEIDELTQLANRRRLDRDFVDLTRDGRVGVASIRIDRFAALGRAYGSETTDELLRQIALTVTANIRPEDVAYRADDDEFVILLPRAGKTETAWVAERVRQAIAAVTIAGLAAVEHPTASIGVTAGEHDDPQELAERARSAMIEAEELGCNRVVLDEAV